MMWMDLVKKDNMLGNIISEEEIKKLYKGRWIVVLESSGIKRIVATSLNEDIINEMKDMYIESSKSLYLGEITVEYID